MATARYNPGYIPQDAPRGLLDAALSSPLTQAIDTVERLGQRAGSIAAASEAEQAVMGGQNPSLLPGLTPMGQAFNEAAIGAYEARTSMDLRAKANELSARFSGVNPTDPQAFAQVFDAHMNEVLGAVPERIRPAIAAEAGARRSASIAAITESANRHELARNVSTINLGLQQDADEAARLARDGAAPEVLGALYARSDARMDQLVALGQIGADEAAMRKADSRAKIRSEAVLGQVIRGQMDGVSAIHDLLTGGKLAEGMPLRERDRLVGDITSELNRRHSEMVRASATADLVSKQARENYSTELWARLYSGDASQRPTSETIIAAQHAGLLDDALARQALDILGTNKVARNDVGTLARLETEMAAGGDVREHIAAEAARGNIAPEMAADLYERNAKARNADIPDYIAQRRRDVVTLYGGEDILGKLDGLDAAKKIDALQFFDDAIRQAPEGRDPQTGYTFREIEANRVLALLQSRKAQEDQPGVSKVPPRAAVFAPRSPAEAMQPVKLDVKNTVRKLILQERVGLITRAELDSELRIIERWKSAGLVK